MWLCINLATEMTSKTLSRPETGTVKDATISWKTKRRRLGMFNASSAMKLRAPWLALIKSRTFGLITSVSTGPQRFTLPMRLKQWYLARWTWRDSKWPIETELKRWFLLSSAITKIARFLAQLDLQFRVEWFSNGIKWNRWFRKTTLQTNSTICLYFARNTGWLDPSLSEKEAKSP